MKWGRHLPELVDFEPRQPTIVGLPTIRDTGVEDYTRLAGVLQRPKQKISYPPENSQVDGRFEMPFVFLSCSFPSGGRLREVMLPRAREYMSPYPETGL